MVNKNTLEFVDLNRATLGDMLYYMHSDDFLRFDSEEKFKLYLHINNKKDLIEPKN